MHFVPKQRTPMNYLRNTLGFDGVVVTDWWALGMQSHVTGITPDGEDLAKMNGRQLYKKMLECGVDMFGTTTTTPGEDIDAKIMSNYLDCIINGVKEGEIDKALVDRAATRILRFKFKHGLFENPYSDAQAAIKLCASSDYTATPIDTFEEYTAAPRNITTKEELKAARNADDVKLDEEMQAASAVLVKNDNSLLPLKKGAKVYVTATSDEMAQHHAKYIANLGTVVGTMEEADVAVGDFTAIDDVAEMLVDDAKKAGKPIVMTLNCIDPTEWAINSAGALMYLSFNQKADHGSQLPGFITTTEPWIYADLLFGEREPRGMIAKELTRGADMDASQWKDLAGDQGASTWVRLILEATMKTSETHTVPENWGDPLIDYKYGMRYGVKGDFAYDTLVVPTALTQVEVTDRRGTKSMQTMAVPAAAKVGQTYNVNFLLWNNGRDDMITVKACEGDKVLAEKLMAVNAKSWRVVSMDKRLYRHQ